MILRHELSMMATSRRYKDSSLCCLFYLSSSSSSFTFSLFSLLNFHSLTMYRSIAFASALVATVRGQSAGTLQAETHPALTWQECTAAGSCTTKNGMVVIDQNWRWLHSTSGSTNCYVCTLKCPRMQLLTVIDRQHLGHNSLPGRCYLHEQLCS